MVTITSSEDGHTVTLSGAGTYLDITAPEPAISVDLSTPAFLQS